MPTRPRLIAFSLIALTAVTATAQTQPTTAPSGLDALDEQRVLAELANHGLATLLRREFDTAHISATQQNGMLALISIRQLADPNANLTFAQRQQMSSDIAGGIDAALPTIKDPTLLMQIAQQMMAVGVNPDVNALEYWGDNPATQKRLLPAAQTVLKIYARAATQAQAAADALANKLTPNDDAGAKHWQQLDQLRTTALFSGFMADYDLCLALDRYDPQRSTTADQAMEGLRTFDTADSGVQGAVRNRLAKLEWVKGNDAAAVTDFSAVIDNPGNAITPAPTPAEQYEARYFSIVAQIQAGKLDDAQQGIDALDPWQRRVLSDDQQKGAAAAYAMLQYRLFNRRADDATDPAEKKKNNDAAVAVLLQLLHDQPQYRTVIFQQLAGRMPAQNNAGEPASTDLSAMDPLLLMAIQQQGEQQVQLLPDQKADPAVLNRAIDAAHELIKRQGQSGVDDATVARSAFVIPFLLQRLGQTKEAAAGFLDYAARFQTPVQTANDALDHATGLIGQLRRDDPQDQDARQLYDKFLPLAIAPPFNRKQFAFEYAVLLQREGQYQQASNYFQQIPPDDPRFPAAQFYQMVALKQRLDDPANPPPPAARQGLILQLQALAEQVTARTNADLAAATSDEQKGRDRSRLVRTVLIAAGTAGQEQHDPQRVLQLLGGFEQQAADLANSADLLSEALSLRVNAYLAMNQPDQATATLVQMLKTKSGDEGPALVFDLLKRFDTQMTTAQSTGDTAAARQLAVNRAALSGFLVSWAANNPDPKVKSLTRRYQLFDAATKQQAAELSDDPSTRTANLESALKQYQSMFDPTNPDPSVQQGIGMVQFDLGHFAEAEQMLGPLVVNKKIGTPMMSIEQNGEPTEVENPLYWETVLKLLQSIQLQSHSHPADPQAGRNLEDAKVYLKQLYVQWPTGVGGRRYHAQFEQLRTALIPDFHVET